MFLQNKKERIGSSNALQWILLTIVFHQAISAHSHPYVISLLLLESLQRLLLAINRHRPVRD
jgi:hypothetical protein